MDICVAEMAVSVGVISFKLGERFLNQKIL